LVEAEVAADREEHPLDTTIRELLQAFRKILAGVGPTMLIEGHEPPAVFEMTQQGVRLETQRPLGVFVSATGRGSQRTVLGRPSSMNPFAVGLDRVLVGARRRPAEPSHSDPHCGSLS
jgi:hypothetical protein